MRRVVVTGLGQVAPHGRDVVDRPRGDREFRMPGGVPVLHPVAVLENHNAIGVDQQGSERLVAVVQCFAGQLDAAVQVTQIIGSDGHGAKFTESQIVDADDPILDGTGDQRRFGAGRPAGRCAS